MTDIEASFIRGLVKKYYEESLKQSPREICGGCGKPRVLGKRGRAKLYCKKCRKED